MDSLTPKWPQFGEGGDIIGARRLRWSFRYLVLGVMLLTFSMWYVEGYKRYDLHETQYRMALTLHPASARPVLRNIIANEKKEGKEPTPKYLQALAAVEEEDKILPAYLDAYRQTPSDTNLLINYGVRLFLADQYLEARDRFREAGIQAPDNALPRYLEAAALVASSIQEGKDPLESGALVDALALIERTNNRNAPVVFPKPLWHPSLPTDNNWHNMKRREIVMLCCAPLYRLETFILPRARKELEAGRLQDWDAWLGTLQDMGRKLVGTPEADAEDVGVVSAQAGLHLQGAALQLRRTIRELSSLEDDSLREHAQRVDDAMKRIAAFEEERTQFVGRQEFLLQRPLKVVVFYTLCIVSGYYVLAWLLGWIVYRASGTKYAKPEDPAWTVSHSSWVIALTALCCATLGGALIAAYRISLETAPSAQAAGMDQALAYGATLGLGLVAAVIPIFIGVIYALFKLPGARRVLESGEPAGNPPEFEPEALMRLRKQRRLASALLLRRIAGIQWGLTVITLCGWFLVFRMIYNAYPIQLLLLTSDLRAQEIELIRSIQEMLSQL